MKHVMLRVIVDIKYYCDVFEKVVEELAAIIFWNKKRCKVFDYYMNI